MRHRTKVIWVGCLVWLLLGTSTEALVARQAASGLRLEWDPNFSGDVLTGYRVRWGTQPGDYQHMTDVGLVQTWLFTTGTPGQRYYFTVTAATTTAESAFAAEVSEVFPGATQAHPCDALTITSATILSGAPQTLGFCAPQTANTDAVTVYVDGVGRLLSPLTIVSPTPNAAGQLYYEMSIGQFARGSYVLTVSGWNKTAEGVPQEGPQTGPFALSVADPVVPPPAPLIKKVGKP